MASIGVKGLVESGLHELPEAYIFGSGVGQTSDETLALPVVDLSLAREVVVESINNACEQYGAFQLVGHEVPTSLMQNVNDLVHQFFDLPAEKRNALYSEDKTKAIRFSSSFKELPDHELWYDYIYHICNPLFTEQDVPNEVPHYWEIASAYVKHVDLLVKKLLSVLSEGLGLACDALGNKMENPWHTMRMNYYPPCPDPQRAVGIGKHTDSGGLTILQQDTVIEGLQTYYNGKWMLLKPMKDAFVVSIGDVLEILSNGRYKSMVHRAVVNQTNTRISIATFYSPNRNVFVSPISDNELHCYNGCKFDDYLKMYAAKVFTAKPAIQIMKI